ncbi:MAG: hypothetical protein HKP61_09020 [Dactylosporangium sp.]|nr:hypothetical protein [Dactylosporangium sp.]NNJ61072.1 hypothetical protein [Dactylosporangium sp.]
MNDVDLDRLADFLGGALDGTPSEAEVRQLVATEPTWRAAYDRLTVATAAAQRDLRLLATTAEPMPADVLGRLGTAIAGQRTVDNRSTPPGRGSPVESGMSQRSGQAPGRRPARGPEHQRPERRGRLTSSARRRWSTIAAVGAVCTVIGLGLGIAGPWGLSTRQEASTSDQAGAAQPESDAAGLSNDSPPGPVVLSSGTDYTPDTLASVGGTVKGQQTAPDAQEYSAPPDDTGSADGPGEATAERRPVELGRLQAADALNQCLAGVAARYGGQVTVVDYARYEGRPALVLVLVDSARAPSGRLIVVVGPSCGLPGGDIDERHVTTA